MWIATREMLADDKVYQPGEVIPNVNEWRDTPKRALINLGWIKEIPEVGDYKVAALTKPVDGKLKEEKAEKKVTKTEA